MFFNIKYFQIFSFFFRLPSYVINLSLKSDNKLFLNFKSLAFNTLLIEIIELNTYSSSFN